MNTFKKGLIGLVLASLGTADADCPTGVVLCRQPDGTIEYFAYDQITVPWYRALAGPDCYSPEEGVGRPLAKVKRTCEAGGGKFVMAVRSVPSAKRVWESDLEEAGISREELVENIKKLQ